MEGRGGGYAPLDQYQRMKAKMSGWWNIIMTFYDPLTNLINQLKCNLGFPSQTSPRSTLNLLSQAEAVEYKELATRRIQEVLLLQLDQSQDRISLGPPVKAFIM